MSAALKLAQLDVGVRARGLKVVPLAEPYTPGEAFPLPFPALAGQRFEVEGLDLLPGEMSLDLNGRHALLRARYGPDKALEALGSPLLVHLPQLVHSMEFVLDVDVAEVELRLASRPLHGRGTFARQTAVTIASTLFIPKFCRIGDVVSGRRSVRMAFYRDHRASGGCVETVQELFGITRPEPETGPAVTMHVKLVQLETTPD